MLTLAEMIKNLDDGNERAIMRLYYIGNHKIMDIAEALGMTERNINRYLNRGRKALTMRYGIDFRYHQRNRV